VVALARVAGAALRAHALPALRILLVAKVLLLLAFFALAVLLGPFPSSDAPAALLTAFTGIAAMSIQNAVQRVHFASLPPSTIMTGNTTQAVLDAVDLIRGVKTEEVPAVRARFRRTLGSILYFACGCGVAAALYYWIGFWCLAVPVGVGAVSAMIRIED